MNADYMGLTLEELEELEDEEDDLIIQAAVAAAIAAAHAVLYYYETPDHDSTLMSQSVGSFATLASGWAPESAYGEPTSANYAHGTSRPRRSSIHDEHNPSLDNTSPLESAVSSASDLHTTPSDRYSSGTVSRTTRDALHTFYERIYGRGSKRCLVTLKKKSLVIAHIVQRTSSPDQVR
jgi:hypothetical protein